MIKKIYIIMSILLTMLLINQFISLAEEVVEFGNTICPISGEEIKEDEAVKHEYKDIIYNFCCKMCLKDFKKDPEKYIEKLEEQKEAEGALEKHEHEHEHHHHY